MDEDEPYFDYAVRVGHNLNGAAGKFVDNYLNIMDNLKILSDGRKNYDTLTDRQKRKHDIAYMVSMHYHSARLTGQIQAGTPMAEFVKMKWAGKPEFDYIVAHWKQYSSEAPPVADVSVEPEPDIAA